MPISIQVSSPAGKRWEKSLACKEFEQVKSYCRQNKEVDLLSATFFPVRTNRWESFKKDFFFPTLVNQVLTKKISSVVERVFMVLGALTLDIASFPIRFIGCIPRVISNAWRKEHPFHRYLRDNGVDQKIVEFDGVTVRLVQKQDETEWGEEKDVYFIEMPEHAWNAKEWFHSRSLVRRGG